MTEHPFVHEAERAYCALVRRLLFIKQLRVNLMARGYEFISAYLLSWGPWDGHTHRWEVTVRHDEKTVTTTVVVGEADFYTAATRDSVGRALDDFVGTRECSSARDCR